MTLSALQIELSFRRFLMEFWVWFLGTEMYISDNQYIPFWNLVFFCYKLILLVTIYVLQWILQISTL